MCCVLLPERGGVFAPAPRELYCRLQQPNQPSCLRPLAGGNLFKWMQKQALWHSLAALRESAAAAQVLVGSLNHEDFIAVQRPGSAIDQVPERPGTPCQVGVTAVKLTDSSSQP